jgi:peptidoglycan/xylan/chitin deacetylase (PgdA/CDA1 family)
MLAGGGIELACHTHTHGNFRGRPEEFSADVAASLDVLRNRFGLSAVALSFPFGIADADLIAAARRSGARCGLSTQAVLVRSSGDPFAWGRFGVAETDTPGTLAARLDGWFSVARHLWLRLGKPVLDGTRRGQPQ